jgi:hypothetical protein
MVDEPILTPEAADENALMQKLGEMGGASTNPFLMRALGWEPTKYWQVRNRLEAQGRVQRRLGGPGGTTFIPPAIQTAITVDEEPPVPVPVGEATAPAFDSEAALYAPILKVLEVEWIGDQAYDSSIVRNTALGGGRNTGGTWTRPDFCVVAIRKFKFLRDPVFDVISFEVKPGWAISVGGVFEALAHRQYATRAYVIYHIGDAAFDSAPEAERIIGLAEQHGIGIFLAEEPGNWEKWTERVRARRWTPDPSDLNDFLQRVFPASDHDEIIKLTK